MDEPSSKPQDDVDGRTTSAPKHPHDASGHFVHVEQPQSPQQVHTFPHPLVDKLIPHGIEVDHKTTDDDILDVHLGNPLRKITALLEEIKKQKAFSFTLKGSLGLAGVAIVLGTFGFFGGTHILCSKGVQSEMGILKVLNITDSPTRVPVLSTFTDMLSLIQGKTIQTKDTKRIVLIRQDGNLLHIPSSSFLDTNKSAGQTVIVTGEYDSCSNTINLKDAQSLQAY